MNAAKIVLRDAFKGYTLDQDKLVSPEETVRRFKASLETLSLDILAGTERIDNGRLGIPVYFSRCGADARRVIGARTQMGKGATPAQAEASAVMELAERYSFFSFAQEPSNFRIAPRAAIGEKATSLETLSQSVNDVSEDPFRIADIFESLPIKWTRAFDFQRQQPVWVPFDWFYAINLYNGTSAGNCTEEALVQGFCEIVERHVCCIVSRERRRTPLIRPESIRSSVTSRLLTQFLNAGIELYLSDFSLDMGLATVAVLAYDPVTWPHQSEIVWTAGAHPNPDKALARALTEAAQLAGDFNTGAQYDASGLPKLKDLKAADHVIHSGLTVDINELPDTADFNFRIELEKVLHAIQNSGFECFTIDISHPKLRIPAFYSIVPGTRFRERAENQGVAMFLAKLVAETLAPSEAAATLDAMAQRLPDRYYLSFYKGLCHLNESAPQTALPLFRRALALDPAVQDIPSIRSYMGICLKDLGRYSEAIDCLNEGISVDGERTDLHNLMGFCYFALKEHHKAIACFQKVVQLNPGSAIDYANIASNYRDLGKFEEAIRYYEKALNLDPTIDFALENYMRLQSLTNGASE